MAKKTDTEATEYFVKWLNSLRNKVIELDKRVEYLETSFPKIIPILEKLLKEQNPCTKDLSHNKENSKGDFDV